MYTRKRRQITDYFRAVKRARFNRRKIRSRRIRRSRRKYSRRRYRPSRASRLYRKTQVEIFRTEVLDLFTINKASAVPFNLVVNPEVHLGQDPVMQWAINNKLLNFEKVKIKSVQYHWWIKDVGDINLQDYVKPLMWKAYDPDDAGIPNPNRVKARLNCKFRRVELGKTYKQTIKPRYATSTTSVQGKDFDTFRSPKFDNPWWDADEMWTNDMSTKKPFNGFPVASNSYKCVIENPIPDHPIVLQGYMTYVLLFKGESRSNDGSRN